MDGITKLAKLLKDRENPHVPSITIGTVIKPPPAVEIRLNDVIILKKEHLIFSSHVLGGYTRNINFTDIIAGVTTTVNTTAEWTDTLVTGDEVIIMPTMDEQLYVVIDKGVRL